MVVLTPASVILFSLAAYELERTLNGGHFSLRHVVVDTIGGSPMALFFGFGPSLLGSIATAAGSAVLARLRLDSVWVSLVLGAVVGLTVPDAPDVLQGLHAGKSWEQAVADRTWIGFWPYFGMAASLMALLNWWIAVRPRRHERLTYGSPIPDTE